MAAEAPVAVLAVNRIRLGEGRLDPSSRFSPATRSSQWAWFTPVGGAHQPRALSDFPRGIQGHKGAFAIQAMEALGAMLSIPIRVDGQVGLGLSVPGDDLGDLRGVSS